MDCGGKEFNKCLGCPGQMLSRTETLWDKKMYRTEAEEEVS
jgi:hypothetical protein